MIKEFPKIRWDIVYYIVNILRDTKLSDESRKEVLELVNKLYARDTKK